MRDTLTLLFILIIFGGAATDAGGTDEQLDFGDARIYAMGGGGYALHNDAFSLGRNAALLTETPSPEFAFGDTFWPESNASTRTAGTVYPAGRTGYFGAYATNLWLPSVTGYDDAGNQTGTFNYHNTEIGLGYGYPVLDWISIGVKSGYHFRKTGGSEPGWVNIGAGLALQPLAFDYIIEDQVGRITLGAALDNFVPGNPKFQVEEYKPDLDADFGLAWSHRIGKSQKITGIVDLNTGAQKKLSFGAEYSIGYTVALRGGLAGDEPAFGAGFSRDLFDFDYAYVFRDLGAVHSVSFSIYLGRDRKARDMKRLTIEKWLDEGRAYYDIENYDMAVRRFENVLEWEPKHEQARYYKARCTYERYNAEGKQYLLKNDWERARRAFNAALVIYPDDFLAKEYINRTNDLEALEELKRQQDDRAASLIAETGSDINRGKLLGGSQGKSIIRGAIRELEALDKELPERDDVAQALTAARRALAAIAPEVEPEIIPEKIVIPESARVRFEMGDARFEDGRLNDAISILAPLVSEHPYYYEARSRLIDAYIYKGLDQYSNGYLSSAITTWQKVLDIDPSNSKAKRYIEQAKAEMEKIRGPR